MLIDTKSLLAKLMATENITVEQRKIPTAMFNVKDRILTVPILAEDITPEKYDLFIGHEVGHALFTPIEGMIEGIKQKINSSILNVVEDSRVERKIKNRYPGLRNSFVRAYTELFDEDFFGTKGTVLNELNLIDRINLHCKVGVRLGINFNQKERELLDAVESTETYEEVIEVSKRIIDYMKQQKKEEEQQQQEMPEEFKNNYSSEQSEVDEDGEQPSEEESENSSTYEEVENTEDMEKSDSDEEDDESEIDGKSDNVDEDSDEDQESDEETDPTDDGEYDDEDDEDFRSLTAESEIENQKKYNSSDAKEYCYANIPKVDINKAIFGYKKIQEEYKKLLKDWPYFYELNTNLYQNIRRETNKVVSYLAKEFELRKNADQLKRASVSKTGELNMSKIFSYTFSEDIFKKITVVPGGKSHGLVMFIDWSGSMSNHLMNTVKQLISLVMFCKKVNIPYEVYAFADDTSTHSYRPDLKVNDLVLDNFSLLNLLSSKMTASEFNFGASLLLTVASDYRKVPSFMQLSSTPLNEAVISAMEIVPQFKKQNNLQMVNTVFLTDGDGAPIRTMYTYDPIKEKYNCKYLQTSRYNPDEIVVVRDPVTRREEKITNTNNLTEQTGAYVRLLKARTNSNVIGFYVISGREFYKKIYDFFPIKREQEIREQFRKHKFAIAENSAFDEYYILRSEGLDTEDDAQLEVKENATTKSLVTAFSKYAGGRVSNRIILNRFIGLIT